MLEVLHQDYVRTAKAKGLELGAGHLQARPAQRAHPGHHAVRPVAAGPDRRRRDHRDDLLAGRASACSGSRPWPARLPGVIAFVMVGGFGVVAGNLLPTCCTASPTRASSTRGRSPWSANDGAGSTTPTEEAEAESAEIDRTAGPQLLAARPPAVPAAPPGGIRRHHADRPRRLAIIVPAITGDALDGDAPVPRRRTPRALQRAGRAHARDPRIQRAGPEHLRAAVAGDRDVAHHRVRGGHHHRRSSACSIGSIAGYAGGWLDNLLMRFVDIVLSLPGLFIIIIFIAFLGRASMWVVILAIGITGWTTAARLVRAEFLSPARGRLRRRGERAGRQPAAHHLAPHAAAGAGADHRRGQPWASPTRWSSSPPSASSASASAPIVPAWGRCSTSRSRLPLPRAVARGLPGVVLILIVLSANFLGDGLRDALDPRQRVEQ